MSGYHETMNEEVIQEMVQRAAVGDRVALTALFGHCRPRLRQMVEVRIDQRLRRRIDPSDVVQEALIDAARMLPEYASQTQLPFYPWLRQIAWNRLVDLHRHHLMAQRRSVSREVPLSAVQSSGLHQYLISSFQAGSDRPEDRLQREETSQRLHRSLAKLGESHREILILRHLEGLSVDETAKLLQLSPIAVTSRHFRALANLRQIFDRTE